MRFTQVELDNMSPAERDGIDSEELPQEPGHTEEQPTVQPGPPKKKRGRPPKNK